MNNMESYRIFLYTAQMGNFTKAAEALHITQPSVSYAIKQLEEALGVKLFDRQARGVRLTLEGQELLSYVEQSFALLERGEQRLIELARLDAGELRIGANGPIIKHLLMPALAQFHASHPHVRIRLFQNKTNEITRRLQEDAIDLGFVHLPIDAPTLEVNPVQNIQDGFFVGEAYRELAAEPISLKQLADIPLLLPTAESSTRQFVEHWLASHGVFKEPDIELTSMEMIVEFAQQGYGAAFITKPFINKELAAGSLYEVKLQESVPLRTIGVITRRMMQLPASAAAFLKLLNQ